MSTTSWFPLFEFQDWTYQSFLVLPTPEEDAALAGTAVTAKKWAKGELLCGQAFRDSVAGSEGYKLDGTLSFRPGVELNVSAKGALGDATMPGTFEATGIGTQGPAKGAIYHLVGVLFPEPPIQKTAARVLSIRGFVRAVRGPDTKPDLDLGGMPLGTVGTFVIGKAKQT
jgi:hypothetical protein